MFRYNNPDALLVLLLVASAYTLVRALEAAGTRWLVATGALIGFAFLAKMMQAFTVVPAFFLVYLIAAPTSLWRRVKQLALCVVAITLSAGWWVATVALWPVGSRPMIDGSPDNSILNLIFDYNGFGRLVSSGVGGGGGGSGFSGSTGAFRLFNDLMGGQASWLIPATLISLIAGLLWRFRAPRGDRTRAALLLWGGWLVVTGLVFSFGQGVIHTYYTVALAPAIAALVAIGAVSLWDQRRRWQARVIGAVAILGTAAWAYELLERSPSYFPWLRIVILASGILSSIGFLAAPLLTHWTRYMAAGAAGLALVACLAGPLAFVGTTITTAYTGSVPSAGASVTSAGVAGQGGFGGGGAQPGAVGGRPTGAASGGTMSGEHAGTRPSGRPNSGTRPSGTAGHNRTQASGAGSPGSAATGSPSAGATTMPGGADTTSAALTKALKADAGAYRWVAATFGSQSAATLELATGGEPVMAIGGFNGEGGNITLAQFEALVSKGDIHYFIASGGGGAVGPGGTTNADSAITSWVKAHFTAKTVGGQTIYDLTSSK